MTEELGTAKTYGDSLSSHRNIEFFSAQSPEELKAQFEQIRLPYKIIAIYGSGGAHVAWVSLTRPIKKTKVVTKKIRKKGSK